MRVKYKEDMKHTWTDNVLFCLILYQCTVLSLQNILLALCSIRWLTTTENGQCCKQWHMQDQSGLLKVKGTQMQTHNGEKFHYTT